MNLRIFSLAQALLLALTAAFPVLVAAQQPVINATSGKVGVAYSYQVSSDAKGTVVYSASGLPPGLGISSSLGTITGTPTTSGSYTGSVSITNALNQVNSATIIIPVTAAEGTPSITSASVAAGTVGTVFTNYGVTASVPAGANPVLSFNIGSLPPGLSVGGTSLAPQISGTPTLVGTYAVLLSANSATGTGAATPLTITIAPALAAPVISGAAAATVASGGTFAYAVAATNDPTSYEASGLPVGLSFNTATGEISGSAAVPGVYAVTLRAYNGSGAGAPFTLTITVGALATVTSPAVATVNVGMPFSYSIAASNNPSSYNVGPLPVGLSANTTTGEITGTPTAAGTANVSISANNITGTGAVLSLAITVGNAPAITSALTASGTVGVAFSYTLAATNIPTAYTVGTLPAGLVYNALASTITGTPSAAGTNSVSVAATNATGSGPSSALVFTIAAAPVSGGGGGGGGGFAGSAPAVTTQPADQTVIEGGSATFTVVASGTAPLTYQWRRELVAISGATAATLTLTGVKPADAGAYSVLIGNALGSTASGPAQLTVTALTTPPSITTQPISRTVPLGNPATFSVVATGASPLAYQWRKAGTAIAGATAATFTIPAAQLTDPGAYSVVVTNATGSVTSAVATLLVDSGSVAPAITTQPVAQTAAIGGTVSFSVAATGTAPLSYQWKKDGVALAGATAATLTLTNVQGADAGSYSVTLTSSAGTLTSSAVTLTIPAARLANVSVRSGAGTGDQTLIVGLALGGTGSKQVLVRAIGPGLTQFGLPGALADPQLRLFNSAGVQTHVNEDWGGGATLSAAFTAVGAFSLPVASQDAALLVPLATGTYTAQVTATSGTGVALLEAYDSDAAVTTTRFVNISARTQVGTGDNILVIGFVVTGTGPRTVLIRAVGPGLTQFGVGGVLADPQLRLFNAAGTATDTNDDWASSAALAAAHGNAFTQTGAFGLPAASKDAALLVTLQPGAYTAQVSGAAGTTGVALVEVYEVP